jgi:hypothetical protein
MNWKKIFTIAALTGFSASVATGQGTAPTIVQGDYISNVFGQSNFIKNPNAKLNTKDVTVSSATVSRSATTPLVATSEFNITTSTATGYADWATRTFDAGMKNQNCEARFTYRGFSVGSTTVQIRQGSNTVAQLTLTASTDPRIASINFPCGDLSAATTLRVQQATAALTGTNEISGIYLGLATNQANVAQAEAVLTVRNNGSGTIANATTTRITYNAVDFDKDGGYSTATGLYTVKRSGRYKVYSRVAFAVVNPFPASIDNYVHIRKNGNDVGTCFWSTPSYAAYPNPTCSADIDANIGDVIDVAITQNTGAARALFAGAWGEMQIARFPTSSELVVTPERQNVWGSVNYTGTAGSLTVRSGQAASNTFDTFSGAAFTSARTLKGKCKAPVSGDNVGCQIENMPVGNYEVSVSGLMFQDPGTTTVACSHRIFETTTSTQVASHTSSRIAASGGLLYQGRTIKGVFNNTAVANRNFVIQAAKGFIADSSTQGQCLLFINTSGDISDVNVTVTPLDQPSNSALYVQGPVQAAATGAAIPAGYVGEVLRYTNNPTNITTNLSWNNFGSITLPAGVWSCSMSTIFTRSTASFAAVTNIWAVFSDTTVSVAYDYQKQALSGGADHLATTFTVFAAGTKPLLLRSTGSTIVWPDGVSRGTNVLYLNGYISNFTSGNPQQHTTGECVRVN